MQISSHVKRRLRLFIGRPAAPIVSKLFSNSMHENADCKFDQLPKQGKQPRLDFFWSARRGDLGNRCFASANWTSPLSEVAVLGHGSS